MSMIDSLTWVSVFRSYSTPPSSRKSVRSHVEIYPIDAHDVDRAKDLVLGRLPLSARDALHVAVMKRRGVERIMSFDSGFDAVDWVQRVS